MKLTDPALIEVLKLLSPDQRREIEACVSAGRPPSWLAAKALRIVKARLKRMARSKTTRR